tara:strand:- start:311 stop:1006 length:696 start_codon:yes stop_codon:yes gene_type:complete
MKETKLNKDQIPINFSFIANKRFYNYIIGKNKIIIDILKDLAISTEPKIIFLRGDNSSGKSHLCSAVATYTKKNIFFLSSLDIQEINNLQLNNVDLLIIDNIDKLINEHYLEEKLFTIVNDSILMKKSIIITSTLSIKKINFQLPDLISRLKWDQVLEIIELDDNDKIKVLQKYAKERGWILEKKVCDYIMSHYRRDLYFLCNSIKYIDDASLSLKKNITIPFIKKIIEYK